MKFKTCFLLILILILVCQLSAQRGGGSRSRSSRSSSRGYSNKSSHTNIFSNIKNTLFSLGLIITAGSCLGIYINYKRTRKTRTITDAYQKKNEENICLLDQDQRNNAINWFMNSNWTVYYKSSTQNSGSFTLKIKDIVKRTDFVYEIQALGERDQLGDSDIKGILLFQDTYLSICFDKVYNDKEKAGQTGKWSVLVYEGIQQGKQIKGRWYFEGFEGNSEYSGEMKMVHQ